LQWLLGKRKLTVDVNYANIPLAYQYLNQYHNMPIPGAGTPLGDRINIPRSVAPQPGPWYTISGAGTPLGDRINIRRSVAPQPGPWCIVPGAGTPLGDSINIPSSVAPHPGPKTLYN
jgi:hypothetical protein